MPNPESTYLILEGGGRNAPALYCLKSDSLYSLTQKCITEFETIHLFKLEPAEIQPPNRFGMKLKHVARIDPTFAVQTCVRDAVFHLQNMPREQVKAVVEETINFLTQTRERILHGLTELEQEPQTEIVEIKEVKP